MTSRSNLQIHFVHHHVRDTIVILEEGNLPHPRCPDCDMFVPWTELKFQHPTTIICARWAEQKLRRLAEEEAIEGICARFKIIWPAPCNDVLFPLPGSDTYGNERQLSGDCMQLEEAEAGMGT